MSNDSYRQLFTGEGLEAWLTCAGNSCVLDFAVSAGSAGTATPLRATVEVLYQPRDQRGLPRGATVTLLRETVDLGPRDGRGIGRCWLVDLRPDLVRECHFRITPEGR